MSLTHYFFYKDKVIPLNSKYSKQIFYTGITIQDNMRADNTLYIAWNCKAGISNKNCMFLAALSRAKYVLLQT